MIANIQKGAVENSGSYNEERKLGIFNTHMTFQQEKQRETSNDLINEFELKVG